MLKFPFIKVFGESKLKHIYDKNYLELDKITRTLLNFFENFREYVKGGYVCQDYLI